MKESSSILYMEDQELDRATQITIKFLKRAGYSVEMATNGSEAVTHLKKSKFKGIIMDIMLPPGNESLRPTNVPKYMGGIKILEMILNDEFAEYGNTKDIPILVVSAVALSSVKESIRELLADKSEARYLMKPVTPTTIVDRLTKAICETYGKK
jgi:CheY-like chemotaxis protein